MAGKVNINNPIFDINAVFQIITGAFDSERARPLDTGSRVGKIISERYRSEIPFHISQNAVICFHRGRFVEAGEHISKLVEIAESGEEGGVSELNRVYVHMTDQIMSSKSVVVQLSQYAERVFILPPARCAAFTYASEIFRRLKPKSKSDILGLKIFFSLMKYYLTAYSGEDLSRRVKLVDLGGNGIFRSIIDSYSPLLKDYPDLSVPFSLINNLAVIVYRAGCISRDEDLIKDSCTLLNRGLSRCHNQTEQEVGVYNLYKMLLLGGFQLSELFRSTKITYHEQLALKDNPDFECVCQANLKTRVTLLDKDSGIESFIDIILVKDLIPKSVIYRM